MSTNSNFTCRTQCGACCIAPSINSPLPNMPQGKKAGQWCVNLDHKSLRCKIWGQVNYPLACQNFQPKSDSCGENRTEALELIQLLEKATAP